VHILECLNPWQSIFSGLRVEIMKFKKYKWWLVLSLFFYWVINLGSHATEVPEPVKANKLTDDAVQAQVTNSADEVVPIEDTVPVDGAEQPDDLIPVDDDVLDELRVTSEVTATKVKLLKLPDGGLYSGDLKFGVMREGDGENEWPNGDRYKGQWLNDSPHGKGLMLRSSKETYQGLFEFGQYSGLGDLKTVTGERYLGQFRFGKLDGPGLFVSTDKEFYLGEFSQGQRHGRFLYFTSLSDKPEYQLWFNDGLEKIIDINDTDYKQQQLLIKELIAGFTVIAEKRLQQRRANTHYQVRGRVRKIVSDVDDSPEHAYGDFIINLLNLEH